MHTIAQNSSLEDLLEQAGFGIRGRCRADCIHCEGGSRGTVSYTDEVAYCHRCHWTGNIRTLSRALALPVAPETTEHREARIRAAQFEQWRATCQRILTDRLRRLCHKADSAARVLARFPDCQPAWDSLANFYHCEVELRAALDLLSFEKASPWIGTPMTHELLADAFNEAMRWEKQSDAA